VCGIAGVIGGPDRVEAMLARLRHRGPDASGRWSAGDVHLGQTRLAISDRPLDPDQPILADQPYVDGGALVYNGELYDWQDQARTLGLAAGNDTAVVAAMLRRHGAAALPRLRGMFALAWWDLARGEGLLARDALGVKPLLYACRDGAVLFASEADALVAGLGGARLDRAALRRWVVAPAWTGDQPPLEGVQAVPAGHFVRLSRRAHGIVAHPPERWWDPPHDPMSADALLTSLRAALPEALALVGRSHLPRAVLLSGGLDSTLVLAHAQPDLAVQADFEDQAAFDYAASALTLDDDRPWAARAASWAGVPLLAAPVARRELPALAEAIARADGHLPAWEQQLTQHALFRALHARGVRVALVGDAADELWAGYHFLLRPDRTSPMGLLAAVGGPTRARLLTNGATALADAALHLPWSADLPPPEAAAAVIRARWLPRLLHNGDLHAMAFGVEARVPFADPVLAALAARTPVALAMRDGVEKWPLRAACSLPDDLRWRRKSALPKDQRAGEVWRADVRRRLQEPSVIAELYDVGAVGQVAAGPLGEWERAALFGVVAWDAWRRARPTLD